MFEELRVASKGGQADYSGITYERIEETGGIFWPCPSEDHPGTPRLFEERFHHPDGMARFHAIEWRPPAESVSRRYPMWLTTGRTVAHYLSGNQTRRIDALVEQTPRPWVEVHPSLGFKNGDPVKVTSPRGSATYPRSGGVDDPRGHGVHPLPLGRDGCRQPHDHRRAGSHFQDPRVQGLRVPGGAGDRDRCSPGTAGPSGRAGLPEVGAFDKLQPSAPQGRGTGRG